MAKAKVLSKGFLVEVESWENDADNYKTKSMTFNNKEKALAVAKMCSELFKSCNNGDGGIGNMMDDEYDEAYSVIREYLYSNPDVAKGIGINDDDIEKDKAIDIVMDYNYELMGVSEWYYSRVFDNLVVYEIEDDVYAEEIFKKRR